MTDRWHQLTAADPSGRAFTPAEGLLGEIRRTPTDPAPEQRRRLWRQLSRGAAVIIAALLVGGAVAWATTGTSPLDRFERIWGLDPDARLSVDRSGYGLKEFSVMEPMSDEPANELPEALKRWLLLPRIVLPKPPPGPVPDGYARPPMRQRPGKIAGWGETTTDAGGRVAVVSMNNRVCIVFDRYHGGDCGTVEQIERKGLATTMRTGGSPTWSGTIGLVTDRVASLRIDYPGYGEVPVRDNVFQVADIPDDRFFLVGRDEGGSVVTRIFVSRPLTPAQRRFIQRAPHMSEGQRERLRSRPAG